MQHTQLAQQTCFVKRAKQKGYGPVAVLKKGDYAKLRTSLLRIADAVDPEGSFGSVA